MKKILKDLAQRVAQLEQSSRPAPGLIVTQSVEEQRRDALSPSERIVEDYYLDDAMKIVMICERITTDAADEGKWFPDGSWNREQFERLRRQPAGTIRLRLLKSLPPELRRCEPPQ